MLGDLYDKGEDVQQDQREAVKCFQKAMPNANALYRLGVAYRDGKGVKQDLLMADIHFAVAARLGHRESAAADSSLFAAFTPQQKDEVQKRLRKWLADPKNYPVLMAIRHQKGQPN